MKKSTSANSSIWEPACAKIWYFNTDIHAFIRSPEHLKEIAGDEYEMAVRVCAYQTDYKKWRLYRTMLATDPAAAVLMREQIVKGYFDAMRASSWQNREYVSKEFMLACPNIRTVAQFLAAYCRREIDVKCEDFADLVQCLRLIGSRGQFDAAKAIQAFKRNNLYRYDSGKELFQYYLAWHSPNTHAVYIAMPKDAHFFNKDRTHYSAQPMSIREFNSRMSDLGDATGADESRLGKKTTEFLIWRLRWD